MWSWISGTITCNCVVICDFQLEGFELSFLASYRDVGLIASSTAEIHHRATETKQPASSAGWDLEFRTAVRALRWDRLEWLRHRSHPSGFLGSGFAGCSCCIGSAISLSGISTSSGT